MTGAILFDRDRVEQLDRLPDRPRRLGRGRLLWVDLDAGSAIQPADVAAAFDLDEVTLRALSTPSERPVFRDGGHFIHLTAYAARLDREGELHPVECVVGESWIVTAHDLPIPVLDDFGHRVSGSGDVGRLDGPGFLAALLEWVLSSYTAAFERIEERLEEFDVRAMRGDGDDSDVESLVEMRRQLGKLRRALSAHRAPLIALTYPELDALGDGASRDRFRSVYARFEATLQEARDSRDAIVGSFDVLIARGGHQTNQIVKLLTLVSVILLPGALLASVMGMNFHPNFFDSAWGFWVVVGCIVGIAPVTVGLAWQQGWIIGRRRAG